MYRYISSLACAAAALAALLAWPEAAAGGIRQGLGVCAEVIIPSLFPFFVLGSALSELAVPERLGRRLAPLMRAFGARGEAAAPLLMGLLGGYPLGAAGVASLRARSPRPARGGRPPARLLQQLRPRLPHRRGRRRRIRLGPGGGGALRRPCPRGAERRDCAEGRG